MKWHFTLVACCLLPLSGFADDSCKAGFDAAQSGSDKKAIGLLTACIDDRRNSDETKSQALLHRAWSFYRLRNFGSAAEDQKRGLSLAPKVDYRSLINYSLYLKRAKRYDESLIFAKIAESVETVKHGKTSMMTQYHIGWALFDMARYKDAVSAFTKGVPYQPDYPAVYWLRAQSYEKLGDNISARKDFETLAKLLQDSQNNQDLGEWQPEASEKLKSLGIKAQ